jgi:hypothetical protein
MIHPETQGAALFSAAPKTSAAQRQSSSRSSIKRYQPSNEFTCACPYIPYMRSQDQLIFSRKWTILAFAKDGKTLGSPRTLNF